jgi:hypothetical protein
MDVSGSGQTVAVLFGQPRAAGVRPAVAFVRIAPQRR